MNYIHSVIDEIHALGMPVSAVVFFALFLLLSVGLSAFATILWNFWDAFTNAVFLLFIACGLFLVWAVGALWGGLRSLFQVKATR